MADPVNILVVDDLPAQRLTITAALGELGERVIAVESGRDALKFLLDHDVAVVLLDVNMPEMDGFETAGLIRQRPRNATTPIIFLTADHDTMQITRGYALGAVDYLTTPFLPDVLRSKVRVFVQLYRARDRVRQEAEQRVALLREQVARTAAEEQSRRLRLLIEVSGILMRTLDGSPFEQALLEVLVPALADEAFIVFGESWKLLGSDVWMGLRDGGFIETRLEPPAGAYVDGKGPAAATSAALDPDEHGRPRVLVQPLAARGQAYASLGLVRRGPATGYSSAEQELVGLAAGRVSMALDTRRLFRELQERDRRKDEFLAMLSHELRNPLGAISTAARLLEAIGSADEHAQRASAIVTRQSAHLARILDDLLDVSRVTAGRIKLDTSTVDLREIADRTLESLRASAQLEQRQISVAGGPVLVEADAARMEQVLTNLIVNAAKYTDAGGRIQVEIESDAERARLKVVDDGIGISPELMSSVFDVFVQGGQALDRAQGGLGIGLTLVRRLVELQGGSVRATSDGPGKGSVFTIELPRLSGEARPRPVEVAPRKRRAPLSVLLVEDHDDARMVLRTLLELRGHTVSEAGTGPEAVEAALRVQPQVALVDLGLPGFDGFEVGRRLRRDARTSGIVLVAVTGYGQAADREQTASIGFEAHLVKPVSPEKLDEVFALVSKRMPRRERLAAS